MVAVVFAVVEVVVVNDVAVVCVVVVTAVVVDVMLITLANASKQTRYEIIPKKKA